MAKLQIYRRGLDQAEANALRVLVKDAAAVPVSAINFVDSIPPADENCDDETFFFLLNRVAMEDKSLEAEISKVPDGGRRAICVWPAGATDATPPAAVRKFSYSIVSWNIERIRTALADDDSVCFETPSGAVLKAPDTKRLECEEEPE